MFRARDQGQYCLQADGQVCVGSSWLSSATGARSSGCLPAFLLLWRPGVDCWAKKAHIHSQPAETLSQNKSDLARAKPDWLRWKLSKSQQQTVINIEKSVCAITPTAQGGLRDESNRAYGRWSLKMLTYWAEGVAKGLRVLAVLQMTQAQFSASTSWLTTTVSAHLMHFGPLWASDKQAVYRHACKLKHLYTHILKINFKTLKNEK